MTAVAEAMVTENMNLVDIAILKFTNYAYTSNNPLYSMEDLKQIGAMGLCKAASSFNPEKDVKFSTYAITAIRNALYSAFEYQGTHEDLNSFSTRLDYDEMEEVLSSEDDIPESLSFTDLTESLASVLSESQREVAKKLFALIANGYSIKESCSILGVPAKKGYNIISSVKNKYKN